MKHLILILILFISCENETQKINPSLKVGDKYQNGIIFYIYQPTDIQYIEGETHGLIAAEQDLSDTYSWGCVMSSVPFSHKLGDGLYNTNIIRNTCSNTNMATACKNEWFVPNIAEFKEMIKIKQLLSLKTDFYWTSSLITSNEASCMKQNGNSDLLHVNYKLNVRPIKQF